MSVPTRLTFDVLPIPDRLDPYDLPHTGATPWVPQPWTQLRGGGAGLTACIFRDRFRRDYPHRFHDQYRAREFTLRPTSPPPSPDTVDQWDDQPTPTTPDTPECWDSPPTQALNNGPEKSDDQPEPQRRAALDDWVDHYYGPPECRHLRTTPMRASSLRGLPRWAAYAARGARGHPKPPFTMPPAFPDDYLTHNE
ncbi:PREDICTED: uncharacterized protein LOC106806697 [Priapulus caudatus]|uniref:Uncharacterized protein LOC106806697 n=1 Tax=Priapulus caudatus TaxID=37621 RepID=A0ABM1DW76_PRICU|nr:PREDICTED: uncharacterized protein LOC106806697 [Priapulus caudatus]